MEIVQRLAIGTVITGVIIGLMVAVPIVPDGAIEAIEPLLNAFSFAFAFIAFWCNWGIVSKVLVAWFGTYVAIQAIKIFQKTKTYFD